MPFGSFLKRWKLSNILGGKIPIRKTYQAPSTIGTTYTTKLNLWNRKLRLKNPFKKDGTRVKSPIGTPRRAFSLGQKIGYPSIGEKVSHPQGHKTIPSERGPTYGREIPKAL